MVKYYNYMVVFEEIPNEITLAINITNCPCKCPGCHSKFLWADVGTELTFDELDKLVEKNNGITCVCFMGGDAEPSYINELAAHMKLKHKGVKTGWYSGMDCVSREIELKLFDYVKIGSYVDVFGGLDKETTNQKMYKVNFDEQGNPDLNDITHLFWERRKNKV